MALTRIPTCSSNDLLHFAVEHLGVAWNEAHRRIYGDGGGPRRGGYHVHYRGDEMTWDTADAFAVREAFMEHHGVDTLNVLED